MCNLTNLVRFSTEDEQQQIIKNTEEVIKQRIEAGKRTTLKVVEIIMKEELIKLRRAN